MKLIKKIFQTSVKVRVFFLIFFMLFIMSGIVFYAFWGLNRFLNKPKSDDDVVFDVSIEKYFKEDRVKKEFSSIHRFLKNKTLLKGIASEHTQKIGQIDKFSLLPEEENFVKKAVLNMSATSWNEIFLFVAKNRSRNIYMDCSEVRKIANSLLSFVLKSKQKDKSFDSRVYVDVYAKMITFLDLNNHIVLSKIFVISMQKRLIYLIHTLFKKNLIEKEELKDLFNSLVKSYHSGISLEQSFYGEFSFFRGAVSRLYQDAGFGCWVLDTIYGDPLKQYFQIVKDFDKGVYKQPVIKTNMELFSYHPLLMIAIPNMKHCKKRVREEEVLLLLLAETLKSEIIIPDLDIERDDVIFIREKDELYARYSEKEKGSSKNLKLKDLYLKSPLPEKK